jgi:hypothetical protein
VDIVQYEQQIVVPSRRKKDKKDKLSGEVRGLPLYLSNECAFDGANSMLPVKPFASSSVIGN